MDFTEKELEEFLGVSARKTEAGGTPDAAPETAGDASDPAPGGGQREDPAAGENRGNKGGKHMDFTDKELERAAEALETDAGGTLDAAPETAGGEGRGQNPASAGGASEGGQELPEGAGEDSRSRVIGLTPNDGEGRRQAAYETALEARDAEHRRALAELEARQERQWKDFFQAAGLQNTVSGKPITSKEEFDAWQRDCQVERLRKELREGTLTREALDAAISGNPAVQAAREAVQQQQEAARAARETQARSAFRARVAEELAEIGKLDPRVKSVEDLLKLPNAQQFCEYVRRGNTYLDAYYLANREQLRQRQEEAARRAAQAAALAARNKDHLRSTGSVGQGAAPVPGDVMELYRQLVPNASEADIQAHYNRMLAENGKGV